MEVVFKRQRGRRNSRKVKRRNKSKKKRMERSRRGRSNNITGFGGSRLRFSRGRGERSEIA